MIYVDGSLMCADTTKELHEFAKEMGINKMFFRTNKDAHPFGHYKVWGNVRKLIMRDERVKYLPKPEFAAKAMLMK